MNAMNSPQVTPGQQRRSRKYRQHEADELYHAEMRAFIARKSREGLSEKDIAAILQVPPRIVRTYLKRSVERTNELNAAGIDTSQLSRRPRSPDALTPLPHRVKRGPGAGPHVRTSPKAAPLVPTKAIKQLHQQAWELRKRQLPFDEIGRLLGITEQEARDAVKRRYAELDQVELESIDEYRKMMVAQLDAMMAALMTKSIGITITGSKVEVDYKAIDRMIKLMDAKADLLGLKAATKVDIRIRLKDWAESEGYDYDEVEDVAAQILAARSERR